MKIISLSRGRSGARNGVLDLRWLWSAPVPGQSPVPARAFPGQTMEFALERDSLWRVAGRVRGVRVDCSRGRLWLTQAGAAADVILRPGESFVANAEGAIVVQPVPGPNGTAEAALGTLTVCVGAARLKICRRHCAAPVRIGMDLAERDRGGAWEHMAFIAVWLCGVFTVWYCLKTVLSLPWSQ
jgi:hypothetical protein